MRKFTILLIAVIFSISSNAGIIYVPSNATDNSKAGVPATVENLKLTDMQAFLSLTPSKVEKMTGKKMTLVQKIALKVAQKNLKKELNKSKGIDTKDKHQMLRLWLIFLAVAVVASIISVFVPYVWIISSLAGLAALIFFILWLIALAG